MTVTQVFKVKVDMEQREILDSADKSRFRSWLRTVYMPLLVDPSFFEKMGFPPWFVRQFLRKHTVVVLGGMVKRGVRGVSEVDFLMGLADALGVETSKTGSKRCGDGRTRAIAQACLKVLDVAEIGASGGDSDDHVAAQEQ